MGNEGIKLDMITKRDGNSWQELNADFQIENNTVAASVSSLPVGETSIEDATRNFERVQKRLKAKVGQEVYTSWFGRLKLHSASRNVYRLSVPTTFLKSWINNKYLDVITELFQTEDDAIMKVEIVVRSATRIPTANLASDADDAPKQLKGPATRVEETNSTAQNRMFTLDQKSNVQRTDVAGANARVQ